VRVHKTGRKETMEKAVGTKDRHAPFLQRERGGYAPFVTKKKGGTDGLTWQSRRKKSLGAVGRRDQTARQTISP